MQLFKGKNERIRERESRKQMRLAVMELVSKAQGDCYQAPDNSFPGRSARFIGSTASRMHRIVSSAWVLVPLALALLYLLMRWTGLSVEINRAGELLFRIG